MTIPHGSDRYGSEVRVPTAGLPAEGLFPADVLHAAAPLAAAACQVPVRRPRSQRSRPPVTGWRGLVAPIRTALVPLTLLVATLGGPSPALAGPMQCITTLEAPSLPATEASSRPPAPVEVTRCAPVETSQQLIERRAYTWSTPFARGVDLLHQVTDLLGIAMGGRDGTQVMGLGFQDQALIWDGTAIQNTAAVLMEEQFTPVPLRTADLPSVFTTSLGSGQQAPPTGGGL